MLWGILMGAMLLLAAAWFMHRYGQEGGAAEVLSLPARLLFTAGALGLIGFVFVRLGPVAALFMILVFGVLLGVMWVPTMVSGLLSPLSNSLTGGNEPIEVKPYYSRALGLLKRGDARAALAEVMAELAKFPGNGEGMLLRARILAEHLDDPRSAGYVLSEMADTPGRDSSERCLALNELADLQLKRLQDSDAARLTWEMVVSEFAETPAAQMARQRLAHLGGALTVGPGAPPPRIQVKEHTVRLGLTEDLGASQVPQEDAAKKVAELVAHLEQHPQDWDAREHLARLYLDPLGRIDLATNQLECLLAETQVPTRHVVRWYNELADLQLKGAEGVPLARTTLERLAARFPGTPYATQAEARLRHLVFDEKAKVSTRTVKLGQYENNLGLRGEAES